MENILVSNTETTALVVTGLLGPTGDITPSLQQLLADTKAAEAVASAGAGTATTAASTASTAAGTATAAAGTASTKASEASASASSAVVSAGTATTGASTATTKAAEAAASATTASTAANTATTKASEASTSATAAAASATTATSKATEASASAVQAGSSKDTVAGLLATFRRVLLGSFATDALAESFASTNLIPITDGIMYENTVSDKFRIYNGTAWQDYDSSAQVSQSAAALSAADASASAGNALASANNAAANAATATAQAGVATAQATAATTQAGVAAAKATIATQAAQDASTQAQQALDSATISSQQATNAGAFAGTATTQALLATNKATEAASSAGAAATSASAAQAQVAAAAGFAVAASVSAGAANTSAGAASGSAASALAIYATAAAQQAALSNAQAAASVAQGFAASAASVVQQDLSGVTSAALHRSPNAVTAMFLYDTSKDSDGGAWTERCQHTSWFNEAVTGKWLGAQPSEFYARNFGGTLGNTLLTNGDFSLGTANWVGTYPTVSVENGRLRCTSTSAPAARATQAITCVIGKTYRVTGDYFVGTDPAGLQIAVCLSAGSTTGNVGSTGSVTTSGTADFLFVATQTTHYIALCANTPNTGTYVEFDNISVREVTALTTSSNDYFQLTTDGKFYKLNPTSGITEVFRGNKRKFPRLAAIVAESNGVAIYDLTEPSRPMWMAFVSSWSLAFSTMLVLAGTSTAPITAVAGVNGEIAVSSSVSSQLSGLNLISLPRDYSRYWTGSERRRYFPLPIGRRNATANTNSQVAELPALASYNINAVTMTVLPDAPVDPVTGLKVPTIAVATAGGVSVIKHNGTVVNSSSTLAFTTVVLNAEYLSVTNNNDVRMWLSGKVADLGAGFNLTVYQANTSEWVRSGSSAFQSKHNRQAFSKRAGASVQVLRHNEANFGRSVFNTLTNTFNTGHLVGDIRRAYLADTDVGSVSGTELVTNGTFDMDTTGWSSVSGGTLSVDSNRLLITNGNFGGAIQTVTVTPGKNYILTGTYTAGSQSTGRVVAYYGNLNGTSVQKDVPTGAFFMVFTGQGASCGVALTLLSGTAGVTGYFDNLSIKECSADRSYKAQAASINGSLVKSQVASAAQLVAYSGFSASNYLREPYSADLDFGTGEWNLGAWVNVPAVLPLAGFPIVGSNLYTNQIPDKEDANGAVSSYDNATKTISVTNTGNQGNGYPALGFNLGMLASKAYEIELQLSGTNANLTQIRVMAGWSNPVSLVIDSNGYAKFRVVPTTTSSNRLYLMVGGIGTAPLSVTLVSLSVRELGTAVLAERAHSSGPKVSFGVTGTSQLTATAFDGTTTRTVTTTAAYNTATWLKAEADYTTDGSLSISVNGQEVAVTRGTPLLSLNSRYNLLNWSENLTNWGSKINIALTAGQPALSAAGASSTLVVPSSASNRKSLFTQVYGPATGVPCIITFLVKPNGYSRIALSDSQHNSIVGQVLIFNLSNSTITSFAGPTTGASITDLGGGVFLCRAAYTPPNITTYLSLNICPVPDSGVTHDYGGPTFAGDGVSGAFIGEIQVINSSIDRTYQRTTTVPETLAAPLTIGNSFALDAAFPGSIALLKASATVPTAEQMVWMYEQEKQMFRDGAQVTLPDANSIVDLAYDDLTDKWMAVSATNESEWSGLIRTSVTPSPAGSYSKITATSGVQLQARTTTNPGVDVTIPAANLREELLKDAEAANKLNAQLAIFDYVGGFTANTTINTTSITSAAGIGYPVSYIGARITGTGIPTDTFILDVSGTTLYLSKPATATGTSVQLSFTDFVLPVGYEAKVVLSAGLARTEGITKEYTRLFDGFKETIRFGTAPGYNTPVQIQATRSM